MVLPLYFFSVGATLPTGQLSNVPWRRTGVKYTNNEAYFDVIEDNFSFVAILIYIDTF